MVWHALPSPVLGSNAHFFSGFLCLTSQPGISWQALMLPASLSQSPARPMREHNGEEGKVGPRP